MGGLSGKGSVATTTAARTMHKTMAKPPSRPTATSAASPKPTAKADAGPRVIAENRRARFDYFIEERYEAGLALEGWEVKALRAGKAQITEAHVYLRGGEVFMVGANISPLKTTSTHVVADPIRSRKLLLNRREIVHLIGLVERKGYTIVPLELYWQRGKAKVCIGLAKGKKAHDKRATEKDRDWARDKARLMRGR
jgi:SsrA-binding protein